MTKHLKILFAEKLPDGNYSTYGNIIPLNTIDAFKKKINENIKNKLYVSTTAYHQDIPAIRVYDNTIVYEVTGYIEEPTGFYMIVGFRDNPASIILFGLIKSGIMSQINIKQLGKISTAEAYHDEYLAKSLQYSFFRWLRRIIPYVDNYYCTHAFHMMAK